MADFRCGKAVFVVLAASGVLLLRLYAADSSRQHQAV